MPIAVQLNVAFLIDGTTYKANMNLPTSAPTAAEPFLFEVTSATGATPPVTSTLLTVAVGATSEVYVAVAPPTALIADAVGSDIVQTLNVVVSEGTYDPTTHTFTATTG